jgi:hypothetical protein
MYLRELGLLQCLLRRTDSPETGAFSTRKAQRIPERFKL